jgi:uncharacterized alpha-E superfamily protein
VLAGRAVTRIPLRRPRLGVEDVAKSVVDIASRVGENLFWMGRYAERCEGLARLLRAGLVRFADAALEAVPALASLTAVGERLKVLPGDDDERTSDRDVAAAAAKEVAAAAGAAAGAVTAAASDPKAAAKAPKSPRDGVASFVAAVVDPSVQGGLAANVLRLHGCANQVRERMSTDNWHVFNRLPQRLPGLEATVGSALASLDEIMLACVSLAGFAMDDMTRDESWQFLLLGRRLERLAHISALVAHVLGLPAAERVAALEWLLEAANSIVTFRARYRRAPELLPVLHLVVFDETNPHSVAFQLRELTAALERTAVEVGGDVLGDGLAPLVEALAQAPLEGFEPESGAELEAACAELAARLALAERVAYEISDDLQRRFFTHAGTPAPLGLGAR